MAIMDLMKIEHHTRKKTRFIYFTAKGVFGCKHHRIFCTGAFGAWLVGVSGYVGNF